jgi:hypothetical protein
MSGFLNLDGKDILGFLIAGVLGYLAGILIPFGWWPAYGPILVSYHLFLLWLMLTGEEKAAVSLSPGTTVLTHLACLVLVISLSMGTHSVRGFAFFRYAIASLAIFERGWLFSGKTAQPRPEPIEEKPPAVILAATGEDYEAWRAYLAQRKPGSRPVGNSVRAEYDQWMRARLQTRGEQAASNAQPETP